jgi:prepilin-type N-terminal cleavage/methylation domain-containing protein
VTREPGPEGRDQGFTLIEMVVSMAIMSIVMAVVIGAITQIYSATHQVDSVSYDREQLTNAFRRLDTQLRYATFVSDPGQPVGGRYYVEYQTSDGICHQLKYSGKDLTMASWTLPGTTPGPPAAIAGDLSLMAGPVKPFTRYSPGDTPYSTLPAGASGVGRQYTPEFFQLRIRFNAVSGRVTIPFDTVFTAQNTSRKTSADNDCRLGRPTS